MKKKLIAAVLFLSMSAQAQMEEVVGDADPARGEGCDLKEMTRVQFLNGLNLRHLVAYKIQDLVRLEKSKGHEPKVFIIGRAGQNMGGVLTLKDQMNGRILTVQDIFKDPDMNPRWYQDGETGQLKLTDMQAAIKKKYADRSRPLVYSHVAFLILKHPVVEDPITTIDGQVLGKGQYWVEELLKPCVDLTPKSFITGLSRFFQDDPHDYRSILMVPRQDIQDKIYDMLINQKRYKDFLGHKYNAATGYVNPREQNSNQFVLEIVAAATVSNPDSIRSRVDTFPILQKTGYRPTKIIANSFKTSMATTPFAPDSFNIRDSENPYARPYSVAEIITELSIREYFLRTGIVAPTGVAEIVLPDKLKIKEPKEEEFNHGTQY